ncbi:restriction endonuclease [Sphingomonas aquatica]|uniref:restriction endonuclease n=1 Tax=Sphingomonas aquatica TaxID=1763824 RepID=UPI00301B8DB3
MPNVLTTDTRRSVNRVFYQQLTAFEAAEKAARGAQLTRETFEQTRKASLAAGEKLEALRTERRSLGASTSRLERVLRVVPYLRQLANFTLDLVGYDDVASFPDDFAAKMRTALDQRNKAETRLEAAIERRDRLKARLEIMCGIGECREDDQLAVPGVDRFRQLLRNERLQMLKLGIMLGRDPGHIGLQCLDQSKICLQIVGKAGDVHITQVDPDLAADAECSKTFEFVILCLKRINVVGIVNDGASTRARAVAVDHVQCLAYVFSQRTKREPERMDRALKSLEQVAVADGLETAIVSADELSDRRAAEAERAASLALALRRIAEARTAVTAAEAETAALVAQGEVRIAQWGNSFPQVLVKHPELASLLQFAQARQLVLDESERLRNSANALALEEAQLAPAVELLERIEQSRKLDTTLSFAARVSAVQNAISRHEQAHAEYGRDTRDREDLARQHKLVEAEVQQLSDAQAAWDAAWPAATGALGLKPDISPADANSAVTEWVGARGVLTAIGQARQRLKRMDDDETSLAKDVRSLATELAIEIGEDCVVAAQMVLARFTDNATAQTQYDGVLPDFEEAKVEADQAQEALGTAREELATLAASAKLDGGDDGALLDAASRCEARMALCNEIALAERTATDVGDKLDLATLRAEWDERDLDEVRAELSEQTSRASEIESEIEAAILAEKAAKDDLAAYLSQSEVNHAVAEREAAAAQMHLALERYLELSVARELVTSAMATIRAEQQDPLIARAGELFTATTLGEFAAIETDIDDKGHPVVVELIQKCIGALNRELRVTKLQYSVQTGIQLDQVTDEQLRDGTGFSVTRNETVKAASARSSVKYDLLGKVSEATDLLRQTVAEILSGIEPSIFEQYRANPEHFISEAARLIKEQKAGHLIEQLVYDPIDERYDADIFTAAEIGQDFSRATERLKNHVFDYCITDSGVERDFVGELDTSAEVEVYAKLPRGFLIPTPVGDYNPDWAIVFRAGAVKHIYFVAETKGSMSSLALRDLERAKIDCAKKFFAKLAETNPTPNVRYGVADSYDKLMEIVTN